MDDQEFVSGSPLATFDSRAKQLTNALKDSLFCECLNHAYSDIRPGRKPPGMARELFGFQQRDS